MPSLETAMDGKDPAPGESALRLAARIASLPDTLRHALQVLQGRHDISTLTAADGPVWVTGGGMSEGPARYLVALLTERRIVAEYVPLSEFVAPDLDPAAPVGDAVSTTVGDTDRSTVPRPGTLVLFSQGLAPNARFPLLHLRQFRRCIVVTAVSPRPAEEAKKDAPSLPSQPTAAMPTTAILHAAQARGAQVLTLPPFDEDGLLLRVVGPAVHALAAAWLVGIDRALLAQVPTIYEAACEATAHLPLAVEESLRRGPDLPPVALIAAGRYANACFGLRWKLLEGLQLADPPIWDLLQVAHGPLQSIWRRPHTLLVLARASQTSIASQTSVDHEGPLQAALAQVFGPPLHRIVTLPAKLPGLLAYFDHDAQLNLRVLDALRGQDNNRRTASLGSPIIDLVDWPGKGHDGPLYGLAPTAVDLRKADLAGPHSTDADGHFPSENQK